MKWTFQERNRNSHVLRIGNLREGKEQWVLLLSDLHWDNPKCKRQKLKKHMDLAVERNAPIFIGGDLFCAMQGKFDKRHSKSDVRAEHQRGDYLDSLTDTAIKWFGPYAKHLCLITEGNHESSIRRIHEIDLLHRLAAGLQYQYKGVTRRGGYSGFLKFAFTYNKTKRTSWDAYYHHGFGGGGPVTMGKIDWSRYMTRARADIYLSGHVHYREAFDLRLSSVNTHGKHERRRVDCVRLGNYKEEWNDGYAGWAVEKNLGPKPIGGYWMRIWLENDVVKRQFITAE
jgi:hypothetical protein